MCRIQDIILPEMLPLKSEGLPDSSAAPRWGYICVPKHTCLPRFTRIFRGPCWAAMGFLFFVAIVLGAQPGPARAQTDSEEATYTVKFIGNWTTSSTTVAVPGSAHFTTLIGAVHNSSVTFWTSGGTATAGVERVAELGSTGMFRTEISNAASGTVKSTVSQSGVGATGTRTFEVTFSRTHPLLTLLSMIGPSPDWFVGVSGLSMLDGSNWRSSRTVNLFAYDAGTEDGEDFSLSNPATNPQGTITSLNGQGKFILNVRMARLTFTLKTPPQNNAPEFTGTSTTRSFLETVGGATVQTAGNVGAPVTATDDDDDTLTYTLEGTDKDEFTIDSNGQIKTRVGKSYDRETKASYSVTVKADDQNGGTDTITVTINVTDAEEKPLAPAMPSVSAASTTSINVMWNAPSNTGRPMITSYDLQYKKSSDTGWSVGPQGVTTTSTSIGSLDENTEYQVQVLASNSDGDGPWSQPGTGRTNMQGNRAPEFSAMSTTRSFLETVGGATVQTAGNVGAPVTATDDDDDTLTYTLEGTDKDEFTIDSSGQIKTRVGKSYDRETKASYSVTVKADDQNGGTDTITVTINVTDAEEKPLAPAMPSVSAASTTSINVMWNAPSNTGRPMITSYDLQYKKSSDTGWSVGPQGVTTTSTSIGSLDENTEYQVQVLASNSDGDGPWSQPGTGRTNMQGNRAPEFSAMSTARSFTETVGGATVQSAGNVGAPVTATDDDDDTLTYTLEGTDKDEFTIDSSGQIKTRVGKSYDRETKASYSVTVKADDQNGGIDTIAVRINVTNRTERPLAPSAPSVFSGSTTSVNVMWNAPSNTGRPRITSYDLQYRQGTSGGWMNGPQNVISTSSTIMNLMEDTEYQVQVRASNADGDSSWSSPGTGRTNVQGNRAPEFPDTRTTQSFTETVGDATVQSAGNVGAPVTATDDDNDTLTYSLEGTDAGKFTIVSTSGQIRTEVGESYNRETKASYSVMVRADDRNGGTDMIAVTINVTDAEEKPLAPAMPSVSAASTMSVNVMWDTPSNTGRPMIISYDLQYKKSSDTGWSDGPQGVTTTNTSIESLDADTEYQVQVRASNSDGDGPWSLPGTGRTEEEIEEICAVFDVIDDQSLKGFVECAAENIGISDTFEETLRLLDEFRDDEGNWNDGSTYLVLLTGRGGVYFHANDREVEDLDWSGILSCEGGGSVLDTEEGCLIEYEQEKSGYAYPFSASYVPLTHGEEEFILLGGFDETPEGEPFTGVIDGPSTEAGEVDTDDELREFVEEAGRALMEAIVNSRIAPVQLRGILRQEGPWKEGDVHVYIMDEAGRLIFDGADREREQKDESAKQYVRDLIAGADEEIVEYMEGDLLRRGYAIRVEVPLDEKGEDSRVYVVGSRYLVEEPSDVGEPSDESDSGGGGCALGGSDSGSMFDLFLAALVLLLAAPLKRHLLEYKTR